MEKYNPKNFPNVDYIIHCFGKKAPAYTGFIASNEFNLYINRHEPLQDLLVTKNKFIDRHPIAQKILKKVLGDSILFMKSNDLWAQKRKILSVSLYKQKLIQMVETMKQIALETNQEWQQRGQIDIVKEISNMMMKNVLACLFGRQNENPIVQYKENGKIIEINLGVSLMKSISRGFERELQLHNLLFPELIDFYFTQFDKELEFNMKQVANYVQKVIDDKRKLISEGTDLNTEDLLGLLLHDQLFQRNDKMIIDECLGLLAAGSQTVAVSITNFLCFISLNKGSELKLKQELCSNLKNFGGDLKALTSELSMEKVEDLEYFKNCYYETLRLENPIPVSSSCSLNEDQEINGLKIQKDDMIIINIHQIHHNSDQWIEDEKYIPERFDRSSKYYLTPAGQPRHPMTFIPFSAGKRACLGRTFTDYAFKVIVPLLLSGNKFEFVDPEHLIKKPQYDSFMFKKPVIEMKVLKQ
ncbi:cytochrome p450 [Stylonychia lemnae]|uniref:Cytochrome p450 n=1 Tax=Stylonychia lemnae TaxID=5949 RepID=A0A078ASE2_STYLE|nr:cytochrome p450 [Stylonychia lemnae]|eukprot:CDW85104.1 cytochrome p450 [Stylonychia lemnae]